MLFYLTSAVLGAAVVLGGGTHSGFLADSGLELLAIPLLCLALWPAFSRESSQRKNARIALALCGAAVLVAVIQLVPLPFDYWSDGSALFPAGSSLPARLQTGAHTISLTPDATWAAILSLIVPLAVFAAAIQLPIQQRMWICFLLTGLGALSLGLGFLQEAGGSASSLRFYSFTNPTDAVGLFANRNHFAAQLNVTLVLAAVWLWMAAEKSLERGALANRAILWLSAAAAFLVADAAGLAMSRSRAGVLIAMVALAGVVMIALKQSPQTERRRRLSAGRISLAAALFALLFAAQFGLGGLLSRLQGDPLEDLRVALNRTTFQTSLGTLPFGTGLGSFVPVYATVEKQEDAFTGFANRAHDDLAELLLETGLIGGSLLLVFLAWFAKRSYAVWSLRDAGMSHAPMLERAASLIIGTLLLHSLVDYPLRTAALGAVFAYFCAILAVPAAAPLHKVHQRQGGRRQPGQRPVAPRPAENWGTELEWPESWQKKQF